MRTLGYDFFIFLSVMERVLYFTHAFVPILSLLGSSPRIDSGHFCFLETRGGGLLVLCSVRHFWVPTLLWCRNSFQQCPWDRTGLLMNSSIPFKIPCHGIADVKSQIFESGKQEHWSYSVSWGHRGKGTKIGKKWDSGVYSSSGHPIGNGTLHTQSPDSLLCPQWQNLHTTLLEWNFALTLPRRKLMESCSRSLELHQLPPG